MGRQAASSAFLKAWVRYAEADPLVCWTNAPGHGELFTRQVRALGAFAPVETASIDDLAPLANAGALWLADPNLAAHAWMRSRAGAQAAYSIVGVTHTTASHGAMDMIADMVIAPVEPWDALICTSRAVRSTVNEILERQQSYLEERFAAKRIALPQLPIIPLGVHPEDFAHQADQRQIWRERLGIGEADVVVLQVGRLSYHAKAHPLPLFLALEEAASRTDLKSHLILAGWFANEGQERLFREGAHAFAPSVKLHIVDGRQSEVRRSIWSAADVFALLADNIQETFGLAPVEAMGAGLPVIVSDWDGFKDTVEHGVHGFRIRTFQPEPGAGDILATRYEAGVDDYDTYVGNSAQSIVVDIAAAAEAFRALFDDPSLRRKMGEAGRRHVLADLSWRKIIHTYQSLLVDLAERQPKTYQRRTLTRPSRLDPYLIFHGYPTTALMRGMKVRSCEKDSVERLSRLHVASGSSTLPPLLPSMFEMAAILASCSVQASSVEELIVKDGTASAGSRLRGIAWLLKVGLLEPLPVPWTPK